MRFDVIAFDADDTLWHSEDGFRRAELRFVELMQPHAPAGVDIAAALTATERKDLPVFGYGVKAFTLSMVDAALAISAHRVPGEVIAELLAVGRDILTAPVELLAHVPEVLDAVGRDHRLVLVTKGDLIHQTQKVQTSGLEHHFEAIEIVLEKDPGTYARIITGLGVRPDRFCMVGNSVRSDVLPVLGLGANAVHVPYPLLWELERSEPHDHDVVSLDSLADLPAWLAS